MSKRTAVFFAAVGVLYAIGPAFPEMDRKEAAAAWSVQRALDTGSWLIPAQPEGPDISKPPVLFWARAAAGALAGRAGTFAVRLPSLLGAAAIVLLTFFLARAAFGRDVARLAAAILVLTPDFYFYSTNGVAGHDVLLCLCLLCVMFFSDGFRRTLRVRHLYFMGIAAGAGCLVKAHTILFFIGASAPLLAVLAFKARARVDRRLVLHAAAAGALAACAGTSWYLVVILKVPGAADAFLRTARFVSTREGEFHLPYYFVEAGFPWSLLWPFAVWGLLKKRLEDPDRSAVLHLLAWIIPAAVVVLFVLRGAPYYLMTLFPVFSILLAREVRNRIAAGAPLRFLVGGAGLVGLLFAAAGVAQAVAMAMPDSAWALRLLSMCGDVSSNGCSPLPWVVVWVAALFLGPWAFLRRSVVDSAKVFRFLCAVAAVVLAVIVTDRAGRAFKPGYNAFASEVNALLERYPDRMCLAATAPQVLPTWWIPCFDRNATPAGIETARGQGRPLFVITYIEQKKSVEALGCENVLSGGASEGDGKRLHLFRCPPR